MTIEQLETINWLNRVYYADKKLTALTAQRDRFREIAQHVTVSYEGNDKGKSSGRKNGIESAMMRIADINMKIDEEAQSLLNIYAEVDNVIQQVDDHISQAILKRRYLAFETMEQIAERMNYSVRSVKYMHKKIIEKIAPFCIVLHPGK